MNLKFKTMKKLILNIIIMGLVVFSANAFDGKNGKKAMKSKEIEVAKLTKQIKKQIKVPKFAHDELINGVVMVHYVIENNTIRVVATNSNDNRFSEYIEEQMNGLTVSSFEELDENHYMRLEFKVD